MMAIDSDILSGLLALPPQDIVELIEIVRNVCHLGQMDDRTKIQMSMLLMNSGATLFESVGGLSYMCNAHSTFQSPIEYRTVV